MDPGRPSAVEGACGGRRPALPRPAHRLFDDRRRNTVADAFGADPSGENGGHNLAAGVHDRSPGVATHHQAPYARHYPFHGPTAVRVAGENPLGPAHAPGARAERAVLGIPEDGDRFPRFGGGER